MRAGRLAFGVTAACAGLCSLPLLAALGGGAGMAGFGAGLLGPEAGLVLLFAAGTVVFLILRRQRATGSAEAGCQCNGAACASGKAADNLHSAPVIACTLGRDDLRDRLAWIRDLAHDHLRSADRTPLTLTLTYDRVAAPKVRELMEKEQSCCSFLRFDIQESADTIRLIVSAPEEAREAADNLFDHFSEMQRVAA